MREDNSSEEYYFYLSVKKIHAKCSHQNAVCILNKESIIMKQ